MTRQTFHSDQAPAPVGPYSQAIVHDGLLYVSGQGPIDPASGRIVHGTIVEEATRVLDNLGTIIEGAGFSLKGVLRTTCYLVDIDDFAEFNQVYAARFSEEPPARTTIQAARLPGDIKVEIDAIVGRLDRD